MLLLCSSSRDRVIHVFAPRQDYTRVQTLADHSGVVTSALFFESEETRQIYLISCGSDRSLLFRVLSVCSILLISALSSRYFATNGFIDVYKIYFESIGRQSDLSRPPYCDPWFRLHIFVDVIMPRTCVLQYTYERTIILEC